MLFPLSVAPCLSLAAHICKLPPAQGFAIPDGPLEQETLYNLARSLGFEANLLQGASIEDIAARPLSAPAMLMLRGKDGPTPVLFAGQEAEKKLALILDPQTSPPTQLRIPFAELARMWEGLALLLSPIRQPHRHARALVSIARHHGKDIAVEDLVHTYLLQGQEPDRKLFMRMLANNGFAGHSSQMTLEGLAQIPAALPVILHCRGEGLLILWGLNSAGVGDSSGAASSSGSSGSSGSNGQGGPSGSSGQIDTLEIENPDQPFAGRATVPVADVLAIWTGEATFIKATEMPSAIPVGPKKFGFAFFMDEIKHMKGNLAEVGLSSLAMQVIGLAMPLFFQLIIDRVVTHHAEATLHVLAIGMLVAILFEGIFSWLRSYLLLHATSIIDLRLAIRTFEHLSSIGLPFFEKIPVGILIKHMQQPEKIREFLTGRLFGAMLDSVSLIVVLPILLAYSWRLTLLVLLFSGLSALVIFLAMGPFRRKLQDLYATEGERQAFLVESIRAMPTIKSLSLEPLRRRGWDNRSAVATGMRFRVGKIGLSINTFMQIVQKIMTLSILWWGVYLIFDNAMSVGALVAFNMYSARVSGPLVQIAGLIQQYQETRISLDMLSQVMDEPQEGGEGRGVLPRLEGALRCRNVTFRYSKDAAAALSDVSFSFPAGSIIGVVGRSGSGKSTLTRLIQRIAPMQEGDIWIDNYNIRDLDIAHLRRSIGVVLQDNFLFRGRVRDNIAMTKPTATLEEIMHAARLAAAHSFIEGLPEGYNTMLEEGGVNLSGGQRQRLAIARALLTDPKLMIFDEATSALDPESEAEIQHNIQAIAKGRTMIIVSHRLSMLRGSTGILVLDAGRLAGAGTHEQLYAQCEIYRTLWDTQASGITAVQGAKGAAS